jgi:hypothetical protein
LRPRPNPAAPVVDRLPHRSPSPDEKALLQNLSQSLKLPSGLVSHLDAQVAQNLET